MPGFNTITGEPSIMFADNCSFDGSQRGGAMTTNGQLWIGSTIAPNVVLGTLTSPMGTVTIGYSSPNITLDVTGGSMAIEQVTVDGGQTIVPSGTPENITLTGNTVANATHAKSVFINKNGANSASVDVQVSAAIASTNITRTGMSAFNSSQFTVDANGFVSSTTGSMTWVQISASQTLVKNTGYFCISPGGALALALPTTASSTIGDLIEVTLDGATSWTITQAAGQQIRFSSSQSTLGAGGSIASTAQGDTIKLVYQASGKWNVITAIGNLTVT